MRGNVREKRVGHELQRELADLLRNEVKDPRVSGLVTITNVDVIHDLSHADVYVTVIGTDDDVSAVVRALNQCTSFLRRALAQRLRLRSVPALRFRFDSSVERGARVARLIEIANAETGAAASDHAGSKPE